MKNILEMVKFNADGLIPAVTQDIRTDEVLMVAYMNEESLRKTIETGLVHYYSRSRRQLWLKGETSGHYQKVRSISVDCDGDTLLIKAEQIGAACHTGHRSCFFTRLDADELKAGLGLTGTESGAAGRTTAGINEAAAGYATACINKSADCGLHTEANDACAVGADSAAGADSASDADGAVQAGPEVLGNVFGVILDRLAHPKEGSYTNYLFTKGLDKILKKIGEEAGEVIIASKNNSAQDIKAEIADLFYHIMVLLAERGLSLNDIYDELKKRE